MDYALITGASKGIGKEIAIELAKRGNNILLVARSEDQLAKLSNEIKKSNKVKCDYLAIDLSKQDAAETVLDWCDENSFEVNILVNNAGYGLSGKFTNHSIETYQNMMQLNMATPLNLILKFVPMLQKHPKSYILNIASAAAYQAVPGLTVYAATKSYLFSLSRGIRHELRNTNTSVTVINPGSTDTDFANRAEVASEKAIKAAKQFNMAPKDVAVIAVDGMYAGKAEVVTGLVNKIAAFAAWLLPKAFVEKQAGGIYGV